MSLNAATVSGSGNNLSVSHGTDENLWVKFYFNKVHEKDFVKIRVPGDQNTEWDQPANDMHKRRFPMQWDAYQRKTSQYGDDTLIDDADFLNAAQKEELAKLNVESVKQLAEMADAFVSRIMGGREMQKKALNFLRTESEFVSAKKMEEENRHLQNTIATQQAQIDELMKQMEELTKPEKRGRPKKNESTDDSPASLS